VFCSEVSSDQQTGEYWTAHWVGREESNIRVVDVYNLIRVHRGITQSVAYNS
jgi:hypothetical protein